MRDIVQNHMLQLVALTAMEPPVDFEPRRCETRRPRCSGPCTARAEARRPRAVRPGVHRGRAGARLPRGARRRADSKTETYVAAKLYVDNWRWADTPFYIRTGKRLPRRETKIAIQFKRAPHPLFEVRRGGPAAERAARSRSSPTRASRSPSARRCPARASRSAPCTWTSSTAASFRVGLPEALRAPDPRLPARRRNALHPRGRGRGAVGARRRDGRALAARPAALPQLRRRRLGACRRPTTSSTATAAPGGGTSAHHVAARAGAGAGRAPRRLHGAGAAPRLRTSVMTHIAWVPERWVEAATGMPAGLAERHPSRTILLFPRPGDFPMTTSSRARSTSAASCAAASSSARSASR